jgi:hypothetical protein
MGANSVRGPLIWIKNPSRIRGRVDRLAVLELVTREGGPWIVVGLGTASDLASTDSLADHILISNATLFLLSTSHHEVHNKAILLAGYSVFHSVAVNSPFVSSPSSL